MMIEPIRRYGKKVIIRPINKVPHPIDERDYRPISLQCVLSKVLFVNKSRLLLIYPTCVIPFSPLIYQTLYQSALLKLIHDLRSSMDSKKLPFYCFLTFPKPLIRSIIMIWLLHSTNLVSLVISWSFLQTF